MINEFSDYCTFLNSSPRRTRLQVVLLRVACDCVTV
jgi:hypothetical protein